jgi:hypothetical protein
MQEIMIGYGKGLYSDWDLWIALSDNHSRLTTSEARLIYISLGFVPFAGFPLLKLPDKES